MILDTRHLFTKLLGTLKIGFVCDIGSRDGRESLLFRSKLPKVSIFAFEANPSNFNGMIKNNKIINNKIQVFPYAITNFDGKTTFNIYDDKTKGTSSLFNTIGKKVQDQIEVQTYRIDSFFNKKGWNLNNTALWIDVEGAGYEVLEGMQKIVDHVSLINIEVETEQIRIGQKTKRDVGDLMTAYGFMELGKSFNERKKKFGDILFIKQNLYNGNKLKYFYLKNQSHFILKLRLFLNIFYRLVGAKNWSKMKKLFLVFNKNQNLL